MNLIAKLKQDHAKNKKKEKALMAIVVGKQGVGKSTSLGGLGVPTLYIHTSKESHGVAAAASFAATCGGSILPAPLDLEELITNDQKLKYLESLLGDIESLKSSSIEAVAVDSTSDLDLLIRGSQEFKKYCLTDKGTHNNFKESEAFITIYQRVIINNFLKLQAAGIHCFTTIAGTSKDHDELGNVSSLNPTLIGFNTAYDVLRCFGTILCQQKVTKELEDGSLKTGYVFVFGTQIVKTSKDTRGSILKMENFSPRIEGVLAQDLPEMMKSDLKEVLKLRKPI